MATEVHAKLLLASLNVKTGDTLFTWELVFPRQILAEFNTHRKLSRNTSSSRAISIQKFRDAVTEDPFVPMSIGANQKGMQAGGELTGWRREWAERVIRAFRYPALFQNWLLEKLGVHKQVANRYLEPWMWCKVVCSATDVNNLLLLRNDDAAEPHFHELARQMARQVQWCRDHRHAFEDSVRSISNPDLDIAEFQRVVPGGWHLPYIMPTEEWRSHDERLALSTARCANTSYTLPGEMRVADIRQATVIVNKLFGGKIKHLSPTEHQAQALQLSVPSANFRGWKQYRSTIPGESGGD